MTDLADRLDALAAKAAKAAPGPWMWVGAALENHSDTVLKCWGGGGLSPNAPDAAFIAALNPKVAAALVAVVKAANAERWGPLDPDESHNAHDRIYRALDALEHELAGGNG